MNLPYYFTIPLGSYTLVPSSPTETNDKFNPLSIEFVGIPTVHVSYTF